MAKFKAPKGKKATPPRPNAAGCILVIVLIFAVIYAVMYYSVTSG